MKSIKIAFAFACMFPCLSNAVPDMSGCEIIGHRTSSLTVEKCSTLPAICKEEPNSNKCIMNIKTPEQCAAEIASENAQMAEKYFAFKCPLNPDFSDYLTLPQVTQLSNYIYSDGTPIEPELLLSDTSHVYVFRMGSGLEGALGRYTPDTSDYLLVSPAANGFNQIEIK